MGKIKCLECSAMTYFKNESREDNLFKKDAEARKLILSVYNLVESDFTNISDYDDYLTEIEEKIDVLVHGNEK
jgi:hypothetical protein